MRISKLPTNRRHRDNRDSEAHARGKAEYQRFTRRVLSFHHEQRGSENRTVHRNKGKEHAKCVVQARAEPIDAHLNQLHHRSDNGNEWLPDWDQETQGI